MRQLIRFSSCIIALAALLLMAAGVASAQSGKMPITTKSDKARQLYLKGLALTDGLQNQEARTYFQQAVEADPEFAIAYLNLSFTQPTAIGFFESYNKAKALADKASEGERLWILGFGALAVSGDAGAQRDMYLKLVGLYPNDERAHNLLGNHYFGQQKYAAAIPEYEKAIKINPDFSQPYNQLGYAYRFSNDYGNAEKTFKKYTELIPNDPNPYDSYAELLLKMGRFDESIANYKKALDINPGFINSYIGIASNLMYKNNHDKARQQLETFYGMAKNDGQRRAILTNMGITYIDQGDYDKALAEWDKQFKLAEAISDTSAMSGDFVQRGNILLAAGKPDKALASYKKAIDIVMPSSLSEETKAQTKLIFLYNAARVHIAKGEFAEAKKMATDYRAMATAANNQFQIYQSFDLDGMIALGEKRYDDAIKSLNQGNPLDTYVLYQTAMAYEKAGNTSMAKKYFDKAAHFNALMNIRNAIIRSKAEMKLASM